MLLECPSILLPALSRPVPRSITWICPLLAHARRPAWTVVLVRRVCAFIEQAVGLHGCGSLLSRARLPLSLSAPPSPSADERERPGSSAGPAWSCVPSHMPASPLRQTSAPAAATRNLAGGPSWVGARGRPSPIARWLAARRVDAPLSSALARSLLPRPAAGRRRSQRYMGAGPSVPSVRCPGRCRTAVTRADRLWTGRRPLPSADGIRGRPRSVVGLLLTPTIPLPPARPPPLPLVLLFTFCSGCPCASTSPHVRPLTSPPLVLARCWPVPVLTLARSLAPPVPSSSRRLPSPAESPCTTPSRLRPRTSRLDAPQLPLLVRPPPCPFARLGLEGELVELTCCVDLALLLRQAAPTLPAHCILARRPGRPLSQPSTASTTSLSPARPYAGWLTVRPTGSF